MSDTTHVQSDSGNERPPTPAEIAARLRALAYEMDCKDAYRLTVGPDKLKVDNDTER